MNCKNGLGECHQNQCVVESCPNLAEFKLIRLQELTFHSFWAQIEFELATHESLMLILEMLENVQIIASSDTVLKQTDYPKP